MKLGFGNVSIGLSGVGSGIFWYVWGHYGFWWGLVYGACWPAWVGFRLAAWLLAS